MKTVSTVLLLVFVAVAVAVGVELDNGVDEDPPMSDLNFWWPGKPDPCVECKAWYDKDRRDTAWLAQLNREIPCPCWSNRGWFSHEAKDQQLKIHWYPDGACLKAGLPLCWKYHPGADGCLRSKKTTSTGARQQCCYSAGGKLIGPYEPGAGTPDRAGEYSKHQEVDVKPYNWCCDQCKKTNYCNYYKQLRRGSNSHC